MNIDECMIGYAATALTWLWIATSSVSKSGTAERRGTGTVVSKAHTAKHKLPCSSFLALGLEKELEGDKTAAAARTFGAWGPLLPAATSDVAGELAEETGRTRLGLPTGTGSSLFSGEGVALSPESPSIFACAAPPPPAAAANALRFLCIAVSVARFTTAAGT